MALKNMQVSSDKKNRIKLFLSYTYEDRDWVWTKEHSFISCLDDIAKELDIDVWWDKDLHAYTDPVAENKILNKLGDCTIAILIISNLYFQKPFTFKKELPAIMSRVAEGTMEAIPILIKELTRPPIHEFSWLVRQSIITLTDPPQILFGKHNKEHRIARETLLGRLKKCARKNRTNGHKLLALSLTTALTMVIVPLITCIKGTSLASQQTPKLFGFVLLANLITHPIIIWRGLVEVIDRRPTRHSVSAISISVLIYVTLIFLFAIGVANPD